MKEVDPNIGMAILQLVQIAMVKSPDTSVVGRVIMDVVNNDFEATDMQLMVLYGGMSTLSLALQNAMADLSASGTAAGPKE